LPREPPFHSADINNFPHEWRLFIVVCSVSLATCVTWKVRILLHDFTLKCTKSRLHNFHSFHLRLCCYYFTSLILLCVLFVGAAANFPPLQNMKTLFERRKNANNCVIVALSRCKAVRQVNGTIYQKVL
jgi:hypothetical protein